MTTTTALAPSLCQDPLAQSFGLLAEVRDSADYLLRAAEGAERPGAARPRAAAAHDLLEIAETIFDALDEAEDLLALLHEPDMPLHGVDVARP